MGCQTCLTCSLIPHCPQGTDRDSGINKQMEFKVAKVQFENIENQISNMAAIFEVVTTQQNDGYVGIIQ